MAKQFLRQKKKVKNDWHGFGRTCSLCPWLCTGNDRDDWAPSIFGIILWQKWARLSVLLHWYSEKVWRTVWQSISRQIIVFACCFFFFLCFSKWWITKKRFCQEWNIPACKVDNSSIIPTATSKALHLYTADTILKSEKVQETVWRETRDVWKTEVLYLCVC